MPRNGSGTYSRAVTPPVNGDVADADLFNDEMDDIATALSNSLAKNGETVPTANLPMGGFKHTGMGEGSATGDSVTYEQIKTIVTTGSANAYVLTSGSSLAAYADGQTFRFRANFSNTASATINVDTLGAKTFKKKDGATNLASGDIQSGGVYSCAYNSTSGFMVLMGGASAAEIAAAYQPLDDDLTAIAALGYTSGSYLLKKTAAATYTLITLSTLGEAFIDTQTLDAAVNATLTLYSNTTTSHDLGVRFRSSGTLAGLIPFPSGSVDGGKAFEYDFTNSRWNCNPGLLVGALLDLSTSTAGQILFPATQNASADANTLDDYEEGTFTPTITFGGGATGVTYTTQSGSYTKIGRQVQFTLTLTLSAKGSSTGSAVIGGLPFSAATATGVAPGICTSFTGLTGALVFTVSTNTITIRQSAATGNSAVAETGLTNTTSIVVSGVYNV